jgi:hypothetical protein
MDKATAAGSADAAGASRSCATTAPGAADALKPNLEWLRRHLPDALRQIEPPRLSVEQGPRRSILRLNQQTEGSDTGADLVDRDARNSDVVVEALSLIKPTARWEAEVPYRVVKGKGQPGHWRHPAASPHGEKHLSGVCC